MENNTLKFEHFIFTILVILIIGIVIILFTDSNFKEINTKLDNIMSKTIANKLPVIKTEYELEIISQDSVKIYNGKIVETININDIQLYMQLDNQ